MNVAMEYCQLLISGLSIPIRPSIIPNKASQRRIVHFTLCTSCCLTSEQRTARAPLTAEPFSRLGRAITLDADPIFVWQKLIRLRLSAPAVKRDDTHFSIKVHLPPGGADKTAPTEVLWQKSNRSSCLLSFSLSWTSHQPWATRGTEPRKCPSAFSTMPKREKTPSPSRDEPK